MATTMSTAATMTTPTEIKTSMEMEMEMVMSMVMAIVTTTEMAMETAMEMAMAMAMDMEMKMEMSTGTAMKTLPVVVADEPDSVMTPQIPLELHTDGQMERQKITCTLVVYAATLPSVTKELLY